MKLYIYKNCGTCRKAVKYLKAKGLEVETLPIREQPPSKAELKRMLGIYDGEMRRLFNTSGQDYRALDMKSRLPEMGVDEAIKLLSENGNLIKRPFLLTEGSGLVGFKENEWDSLFF
ncbi:MAG: Spx/MgsR family RNA polymerase-binding regulatory protein [Verrucomicrobiales bacterium]|nr:Spx/MgsR family RNA polymerase-binding regulatory protein [Verrucomicrobiales bacterium]